MPTFHPLEPRDYQFALVCDDCLAVVIGMPGHTAWHEHMALPTDGPAPVEPTPVVHHYTTEAPAAGGWDILGSAFTSHDDACTHTPKLPSRADAAKELNRIYAEGSRFDVPSGPERKAGIEAVVTRVFKYLETGR